jgi:cell fate (sporulation/competence/biofilm development) regulator YlbF (YheA/YmcA/DUF963 family)
MNLVQSIAKIGFGKMQKTIDLEGRIKELQKEKQVLELLLHEINKTIFELQENIRALDPDNQIKLRKETGWTGES